MHDMLPLVYNNSLMSSIERRSILSGVNLLNNCHKCMLMKADIREMIPAYCVQFETQQLPLTDKQYNFTLLFLSCLKQGIWPGI